MGIQHGTMIKREIPRQMAKDCTVKLDSIILIIANSNKLFDSGSTASSAISTMMYGNLAINIVM